MEHDCSYYIALIDMRVSEDVPLFQRVRMLGEERNKLIPLLREDPFTIKMINRYIDLVFERGVEYELDNS
jgi:hypothetical protein